MTNYNKATLATFFQQNDIPTGTDYANLIDSQVNLVETSVQTMAGPLSCTELITARVSASNVVFGGNTFEINTATITTINVGSNLTIGAQNSIITSASNNITTSAGNSISFYADTGITLSRSYSTFDGSILQMGSNVLLDNQGGNITISTGGSNNININASGSNINLLSPTVLASGAFVTQNPVIISAAGTTQATAALLTSVVNRGKGVVDGSTTGFRPLANKAGLVQYLYNEGASANLWPPVGGTINGLAANAPFPLATSAMVTIVHLTSSAMAVK